MLFYNTGTIEFIFDGSFSVPSHSQFMYRDKYSRVGQSDTAIPGEHKRTQLVTYLWLGISISSLLLIHLPLLSVWEQHAELKVTLLLYYRFISAAGLQLGCGPAFSPGSLRR